MWFIKGILWMLLAIAIATLGAMTRRYQAFGGEDLLALMLVGYGAYVMLKGETEC